MKFKLLLLGVMCFANAVHARLTNEVIVLNLPVNQKSTQRFQSSIQAVGVLKAIFDEKEQQIILKRSRAAKTAFSSSLKDKLPSSVELGMNHVPVLYQGTHGSCATFSFIAAIDALRGEGEFYSPLCFLNLGKFLHTQGYHASGWDGISNYLVMNRIKEFGLIPMDVQKSRGCGGLTEYPVDDKDDSNPMTIDEYHQYSQNVSHNELHDFHVLLDFDMLYFDKFDVQETIHQVRRALSSGHRLVVMMSGASDEYFGLHGKYKDTPDSWVLSDKLINTMANDPQYFDHFYYHDMVVTGYDDNAVIKDIDGKEHIGLFKVRNSWGDKLGDQGDFYISYDYLAALVYQLIEVR